MHGGVLDAEGRSVQLAGWLRARKVQALLGGSVPARDALWVSLCEAGKRFGVLCVHSGGLGGGQRA